mgnify:CR=1 FL=1
MFLLYAPRVKAHPRGSGQPRGHSRPQVVSPGSSRPNEESIQPSAHSRKAGGGTLIPAPKAHADTRRPCVQPRTLFGNPSTPIGSQGPFWAGGQAPPIHRGDEHRGRASFMPSRGMYTYIYIYIYIYVYTCARIDARQGGPALAAFESERLLSQNGL